MQRFIHPVLSGIISSLASLVGQSYFNLTDYTITHILRLILAIVVFALLNQMQYKFLFNSFQLNGATISTLIVFITQNVTIGLSRLTELSYKWWLGCVLVSLGVYVLKKDRDQIAQKSQ